MRTPPRREGPDVHPPARRPSHWREPAHSPSATAQERRGPVPALPPRRKRSERVVRRLRQHHPAWGSSERQLSNERLSRRQVNMAIPVCHSIVLPKGDLTTWREADPSPP